MLNRKFDPTKPHRYAIYVRMSDKKQNERSPDQQINEIKRVIERQKLPWQEIATFRDDGRKGAYLRKRKSFNQMLNQIRTGSLIVDVIAVDTTERFARSEEMPAIRKELYEKYGVLVVTAESSFSDPLTPQGKIYAAVEAMRSTEENRIKGHQILRSKRDLANRKFWPGGLAPAGLRLKKVIEDRVGVEKVIGSILVPDDDFKRFVRMAFERTRETGEGASKVAIFLKAQQGFPPDLELSGSTVAYWLQNRIYKGVLVYPANCTGIVDDVRKVEPNDPDDILIVEEFCEPIVEPQLWDAVEAIRNARKRKPAIVPNDGKMIKPLAPGFTISHMLSGLTRCGCCGGSMRPASSGCKNKEGKRYTYYVCPLKLDGRCENTTSIPEPWLREKVIGYLKSKLFVNASDPEMETLAELKKRVKRYVKQRSEETEDPRPQLQSAIDTIDRKISGWVQSLGKPNLLAAVRHQIENSMGEETERRNELERALTNLNRVQEQETFEINDAEIERHIERLDQVLENSNPTLAHLELSLHIDKIDCYRDGTVQVRFCSLGVAGLDAIETMTLLEDVPESPADSGRKCKPRRRARLHANSGSHDTSDLDALSHWATDPFRFASMGKHWFETVSFSVPEPTFWAKENAIEVSTKRLEGLTHERLAEHFGVSLPTIRKALKIGREIDTKFDAGPRRLARPRWDIQNAATVYEASKHMMMKEMVIHFGKSDVTLRKAVKHAKDVLGMS